MFPEPRIMSSTLLLVPNKYFLKKCNRKKFMLCSSSISFRMGNLGLAWEETRQFGDDEMSIEGEKSDDD